jgi:hypothetical protein
MRSAKENTMYIEIRSQPHEMLFMIEVEEKRQAYYKKINSLPIDDRHRRGKKK